MKKASVGAMFILFTASGAYGATASAQPVESAPALLDGVGLLGPPPAPGSPAQAADAAGLHQSWPQERVAQAATDTEFDPFLAFSPVLGKAFTADAFPATKRVFDRVEETMSAPLYAVKVHWARTRPFVAEPGLSTCVPVTDSLRTNGAYPSGHATAGWAWALILTELIPERTDDLLARGRQFGESRVVCGLHWPSDNVASQVLGAALTARLHGDGAFRAQLEDARGELARLGGVSAPGS